MTDSFPPNSKCFICQATIDESNPVFIGDCKHTYHRHCMENEFKSNVSKRPECRCCDLKVKFYKDNQDKILKQKELDGTLGKKKDSKGKGPGPDTCGAQ